MEKNHETMESALIYSKALTKYIIASYILQLIEK